MGIMDKARGAAVQAKASAQQLAQQGQAKVGSIQQGRTEAELYRTLGQAYYGAQRSGGDPGAVTAALTALDEHFAALAAQPAGGTDTAASAPAATSDAATATPPATTQAPPAAE